MQAENPGLKPKKEITEKQRRFANAYMGEAAGNATEAARLAGYGGSESALGKIGFDNLRNPKITKIIEELSRNDPLVATREERQRFWSAAMRGKEADGTEAENIRWQDRIKASELLGKSQADFVERKEVTGKNGGPIELSEMSDEELRERAKEILGSE